MNFALKRQIIFIRRFMGLTQIVAQLWCFLLNHIRHIRTYKFNCCAIFAHAKALRRKDIFVEICPQIYGISADFRSAAILCCVFSQHRNAVVRNCFKGAKSIFFTARDCGGTIMNGGCLRQGLERIAGDNEKLTKAGGKERPKEAPLPPFAFVVFCYRRYEWKARSRPNIINSEIS